MTHPHYTLDRCLQEWDLRRLFNEGHYEDKVKRDELIPRLERSNPLKPNKIATLKNVKPGARTETILYLDLNDNLVVELHRYKNPDGSLGGPARKNDPKTIIIDGVKYHRASPNDPKPPRLKSREVNAILHKHGLAATVTYFLTVKGHLRHLVFLLIRR
jgi:hypothetical protein